MKRKREIEISYVQRNIDIRYLAKALYEQMRQDNPKEVNGEVNKKEFHESKERSKYGA